MAKDEKRIDGFLGILTSTEEPAEAEKREDDADADQAEKGATEEKKPRSAKSKETGSGGGPERKRASGSTKRTRPTSSAKDSGTVGASANEPVVEQATSEKRAGKPRASGSVEAAGATAMSPATDLAGQLLHIPQREQLPLRIPKNHRFPADLYDKIEAIVYWERLPSNTQFIVNACQTAIEALEAKRGKPYPPKPS